MLFVIFVWYPYSIFPTLEKRLFGKHSTIRLAVRQSAVSDPLPESRCGRPCAYVITMIGATDNGKHYCLRNSNNIWLSFDLLNVIGCLVSSLFVPFSVPSEFKTTSARDFSVFCSHNNRVEDSNFFCSSRRIVSKCSPMNFVPAARRWPPCDHWK